MFKSNFKIRNVAQGETFYKNLRRRVDLLNAITHTKNVTYIRTGDQYVLVSNTEGKQWHIKYIAVMEHIATSDGQYMCDVEFKIAPAHRRIVRFTLWVSLLVTAIVTLLGWVGLKDVNLGLVRALQFTGIGVFVVTLVIAYIEFYLMEKRIKSLVAYKRDSIGYNNKLATE